MKRLIVNADDFGLTRTMNAGIMKAYEHGIVTDMSLLPTGPAFEDAVDLANAGGIKTFGVHLSLTKFLPICHGNEVATLIAKNGKFHKNRGAFMFHYVMNRISLKEIYCELKSQFEEVLEAGFTITHVNSHEHLHLVPEILELVVDLARVFKVPTIRSLGGDMFLDSASFNKIYRSLIASLLGKRSKETLRKNNLYFPDYLIGFLDSGALNETLLEKMLKKLKDGITELICHPGFLGPEISKKFTFHLNCEDELSALTSAKIKNLCGSLGIQLVCFKDFTPVSRKQ